MWIQQNQPLKFIKPAEDARHFHQGDTFDFEALFTDNEALKSYMVEIHFNGDGHEHNAIVKSTTEDDHVEWEQSWSGDLTEAKEDRAVISGIEVPANAEPGEYHLGVYCFDTAGNESQVFIDIEVEEEGHEH